MNLRESIKNELEKAENKTDFLNELREYIHSLSPRNENPVDLIRWIPLDMVQANDYNPNTVARNELKLLYTSIDHDGYTQPVVTIFDEKIGKYVIIDGFHRYFVLKTNADLLTRNEGYLPVVVLEKSINDRMASTIRHNRARGKHSIDGMGNIVFNMLDNGWKDEDICNELGMEVDELLRLKHITGFSKLFENMKYKKAWKTKNQIKYEKGYKDASNTSK